MREIEYQGQTLANNCVSACLAMVLNKPVEQVTEEFHNKYWQHAKTPFDYLKDYGCSGFVPTVDKAGKLQEGYIYLLRVPSLSERGQFHGILLDARNVNICEPPKVYDPAVTSRQKYIYPGQLNDPLKEFELVSWIVECAISYSPALED
ncbi:MAG: hypothetical protein ACRDCY_18040 [Aeromonas veronii]